MSTYDCECGYQAASDDDLTAHLGEWLIPRDDTAEDGAVHAEAARDPGPHLAGDHGVAAKSGNSASPLTSRCLCGFTARTSAALDAHLIAVFTEPDAIHRLVRQPSLA